MLVHIEAWDQALPMSTEKKKNEKEKKNPKTMEYFSLF